MQLEQKHNWDLKKNCATQYSNLLEKVETPKRKRGDRGEIEIPAKQIVVKLTIERIEELKKQVVEYQQRYKKLKRDLEIVYSGQWDEQIKDKWEQTQAEKKKEDDAKREEERKLQEMYAARTAAQGQRAGVRRPSAGSQGTMSEIDESTQDSPGIDVSALTDEENSQPATSTPTVAPLTLTPSVPTGEGVTARSNPPPSPLLSHLLKSRQTSTYGLHRLKLEQEQVLKQEQQQHQVQHDHIGMAASTTAGLLTRDQATDIAVAADNTISTGQPAATEAEGSATTTSSALKVEAPSEATDTSVSSGSAGQDQGSENVVIKQEVKDESQESLPSSESTIDQKPTPTGEVKDEDGADERDVTEQKTEQITDVEGESQDEEESTNYVSVDEEVSIKEEPASPASSVISNVSETRGRRSRGRGARSRASQRVPRKSIAEKDDGSSKHSEAELTDDDAARESDGDVLANQPTSVATSVFAESVPNSPASTGISDTEDERAYKSWKKSIMLVWRSAANHKYANVFHHPVTDDIAPGYHAVVHRPMDLVTIKKNIESGALRTTAEFQRDMMLMFTNAIMYNSSNHNVYKMAKEMYDDVMEHIEQYVSAQLMMQSSETKVLRQSRRSELPDKEEDSKKRRGSVEQTQEGGKTKKRKTRGDE
nr:hypothetical protein BaRGS_029278 [Batillaria attramentaria]